MGIQVGINAKLYYKIGGFAGGGSWVELANARDVTVNLTKDAADVTTRDNGGWRAKIGTLKECTVSFEMVKNNADPAYIAVRDAYLATNAPIGIRALDEDGYGIEGDFDVSDFSESQPLEGGITNSVTLELRTFSQMLP